MDETDQQGAAAYHQRVYFSDTDAGGIMYHARYLDLTEHARTELLRTLGGLQSTHIESQRIGFVVASLSIEYTSPAYLDDLLTVITSVVSCERFSMILQQNIMREKQPLAQQRTKIGFIHLDKKRPVPIPPEWRSRFLETMSSPS